MKIEKIRNALQRNEYSIEEFRRRINQPIEDAGMEPASARSHRMVDDMRNYLARFFQLARFASLVEAYNDEVMEFWWRTVHKTVEHALSEIQGPNGVPDEFLKQATQVSINGTAPVSLELSYNAHVVGTGSMEFPVAVTVPAISYRRQKDHVDITSAYNWPHIHKELKHYEAAVEDIKHKIMNSHRRLNNLLDSHSSTGQMLKYVNDWDRELMEIAIDAYFCDDDFISTHVIIDKQLYNRSTSNVFLPVGLGYKSPVMRTARMPAKLQSRPLPVATQFLEKPPMEALPQPIDERQREIVERACEVNNALEMLFEAMGEDCVLAQSSKHRLINDLTGPIIQSAVS